MAESQVKNNLVLKPREVEVILWYYSLLKEASFDFLVAISKS